MPRTQVLMTKELFNRFKKVPFGSTDGKPHEEQKVLAKFFNPTGIGTWYITEFDGDDTLYGLCCLQEKELGYVSLKELQNMVVHGDADRAVWRLVDAAALIGQASEDKTLGGFGEPTGRGFQIVQTRPVLDVVYAEDLVASPEVQEINRKLALGDDE